MSSKASLTLWGEVASLALVGHPSSDGVTMKMPYEIDVLHLPTLHPIFSIELVKTESDYIVRSVEMVNFPTRIPDYYSHSPALLDLFHSSDASICFTMTFAPLGNSNQVVVSVSIDFPSYSQWNAPFHRIASDYSCADWEVLCDHLKDVPWENVFKLSASTAASKFCGWVQVRIYKYIPHWKNQVKSHSAFSCLCCCHSS